MIHITYLHELRVYNNKIKIIKLKFDQQYQTNLNTMYYSE